MFNDDRTLTVLRTIASGAVTWSVGGKRVQFRVRTGPVQYERGPDGIERLSERLYRRDGFEFRNTGTVTLTAAGEQLLAELENEQ